MTVAGARERGQRRWVQLEKNDSYQGIASAMPQGVVGGGP